MTIKIKATNPKEFSVSLTMDRATAQVVLDALEEQRSTMNIEEFPVEFEALTEITMGLEELL